MQSLLQRLQIESLYRVKFLQKHGKLSMTDIANAFSPRLVALGEGIFYVLEKALLYECVKILSSESSQENNSVDR